MADETAQQARDANRIIEGLTAPIFDLSQQLIAEFQALEDAVTNNDRAAVDLQAENEAGRRRIAELEALLADYDAIKVQRDAAEEKFLNIKRLVEEIGMERDRFGVRISDSNAKLDEMQQMINDRDALIAELQGGGQEVAQLRADIEFHLRQNAMLRKDLNAMDSRLVEAEQKRERLEKLLHRLAPTLLPAQDVQAEALAISAPAAPSASKNKSPSETGSRGRKRSVGTEG